MSAAPSLARPATTRLDFTLPPELEARQPPEARGIPRDGVRLLVAEPGRPGRHHTLDELPELLVPGDVVVVNRSAPLPAAVDLEAGDGAGRAVHFSTTTPDGTWLVELRDRLGPDRRGAPGRHVVLPGGGRLTLLGRHEGGRLWRVRTQLPPATPTVLSYLQRHGRPIRYDYVDRAWPLAYYQTVFADVPGSAEMPSAGRAFSPDVVTRLIARGVLFAPITLHTGVASAEEHEAPYAEWFEVPEPTARLVNDAHHRRARVIAIGTTVVRALESAVRFDGRVEASAGWTDLVVTPERGVHAVNGLLTGFHEPRASHLLMLEAIAGRELIASTYRAALSERYLWHEFGDLNLLLT